jgi:Glycosyltransferase family 87
MRTVSETLVSRIDRASHPTVSAVPCEQALPHPPPSIESSMNHSAGITLSPSFQRFALAIAALNGLAGVKRVVESFLPGQLYKKDFMSPYLMAKAMLAGVDPYQTLPELAAKLIQITGDNPFAGPAPHLNHPTPHTPFMGLASLPFALVGYETAAALWLIVELVCLAASLALLMRWWGSPVKASNAALLLIAALGWVPVVEDLWFGQVTLCLLLLLTGAWLALRDGKDAPGGALLGGLIALKLTAWPIVLFLALRRRWTAVGAAALTALAANLAAMPLIGFESVKAYYLKVGPALASYYRSHDTNFSAWTLGRRLFAGFGNNFHSSPLLASELLAAVFTILAPAAVLLLGLRAAWKSKNFDTAFGILTGVGILVGPIAWTHYLILALIPMAIVARRLSAMGWPRRMTYQAFCFLAPLSLAQAAYSSAIGLLAANANLNGAPSVPFAAGLITLVPAAALVGMLWLLWRLDGVEFLQHNRIAWEHEFERAGETQIV